MATITVTLASVLSMNCSHPTEKHAAGNEVLSTGLLTGMGFRRTADQEQIINEIAADARSRVEIIHRLESSGRAAVDKF